MNFQLNKKIGNWLKQLNGKTVDKIYYVDFNENRQEDDYLPWIFFITLSDHDQFLEIEGDFDGSHIKINLYENSILDNKLEDNNLPDNPDLWRIYETSPNEKLGLLLSQKIDFIEFGIDKNEYEIKGIIIKGEKDIFNFIRFNCKELSLTIFEGSVTGLEVSDNKNIKLNFENTFDNYNTK